MIAKHSVDGYHHESKTVFQYHSCHFHGCSTCYPSPKEREVVICEQKEKGLMIKITREKRIKEPCAEMRKLKQRVLIWLFVGSTRPLDHGGMIVYQKRAMRCSLMQLYMILNLIKTQQKELWQHKI